jgi:hypothetical protein
VKYTSKIPALAGGYRRGCNSYKALPTIESKGLSVLCKNERPDVVLTAKLSKESLATNSEKRL